jgi:hypothetical protein
MLSHASHRYLVLTTHMKRGYQGDVMNTAKKTQMRSRVIRSTKVDRTAPPPEDVIKGFKPEIPEAFSDGSVPNEALANGLLIRAPIIRSPVHVTQPGNEFEIVLDGAVVPGTATTYKEGPEKYVKLTLPPAIGTGLEAGFHDIAYRDTPRPIGDVVRSEAVQILVDRTPPGARRLPRIEFSESIQRDGLSLLTLAALPGEQLEGLIPGYEGLHATDVLHLCMKGRDGSEIRVGSTPLSEQDEPTVVVFPKEKLMQLTRDGVVDFYYYAEDRANNVSMASLTTPISVLFRDAPSVLPPAIVATSSEGLIMECDVKPALSIDIPKLVPPSRSGDTIVLTVDDEAIFSLRLGEDHDGSTNTAQFFIPYGEVWGYVMSQASDTVLMGIAYRHYRGGVRSDAKPVRFTVDLRVPGGRDPNPETPEHENLPLPILRGARGVQDDVISFDEVEFDATVIIGDNQKGDGFASPFVVDDIITVSLDGIDVGEPKRLGSADLPVTVTVPSIDLRTNAGSRALSYAARRKLATDNAVSVAWSPSKSVRIDSVAGLPGGGGPLPSAIFVAAAHREEWSGFYAIYLRDIQEDHTALRVYGYINMAAGDLIEVDYVGFDAFDGGAEVESASGTLSYNVKESDLVPRDDGFERKSELPFADIPFSTQIVRRLAFGRFELNYTVRNKIGEVVTKCRAVLVSART